MSTAERRRWAIFACVLTLLTVAIPVYFTSTLAYLDFSGCFFICEEARPLAGFAWSAVSALLLAVPFVLGMAIARVRSRVAWTSLAVLVLVAVVAWAGLSVGVFAPLEPVGG